MAGDAGSTSSLLPLAILVRPWPLSTCFLLAFALAWLLVKPAQEGGGLGHT